MIEPLFLHRSIATDMIEIMSAIHSLFDTADGVALSFAKGACLFHQGDLVRSVYRLTDGAVQLRRQQVDGAFVVLQRALPGDILAEASMFAERYHCDALAVAPTQTWAAPVTTLRVRLAASSEHAMAFAAHLAGEVQAARLRAEILGRKTVSERLEAWLLWQQGRMVERGSWALLAGELGVTPEALYRELAKRRRRRD